MQLKPVIASYTGESYRKILDNLTPEAMEAITYVAQSPRKPGDIAKALTDELLEMHVFREEEGQLLLNTAVFLAQDISQAADLGAGMGRKLAEIALEYNDSFSGCSPQLKNLLATMLGINQGLSLVLRSQKDALDWSNYLGKYARAKVDFDQVCPQLEALGPDLQNKTVLRGERYTAVFIGTGGNAFSSFISLTGPQDFSQAMVQYITDALASCAAGEEVPPPLARAAQALGLAQEGTSKSLVLTRETYARFQAPVGLLAQAAQKYYMDQLPQIRQFLSQTTAGLQGVPPANMMMHFWRYCRRSLARELYSSGFLTDGAQELGTITVFYDNSLAEVRNLL